MRHDCKILLLIDSMKSYISKFLLHTFICDYNLLGDLFAIH